MPPAAARTAALLDTIDLSAEPSFYELLQHLYTQRFNGPVILHCENGIPKIVEFTQPVRINLGKGGA